MLLSFFLSLGLALMPFLGDTFFHTPLLIRETLNSVRKSNREQCNQH
jgi:hypothetical protein